MSLDYFINKGCSYQKFIERTPKNRERLDKVYSSVKIPKDLKDQITRINAKIRILVFAENWCSDTVLNLPILAKLSELSKNIDLIVVPRDDVMEEFKKSYLTDGKAKIPLALFLLDRKEEIHRFVERTKHVAESVKEIKSKEIKEPDIYRSVVELYLRKDTIEKTTKILACELIKVEQIALTTMK